MNKQTEALKLALDALEVLGWQPTEEAMDYRDNAIDAIREALAEQRSGIKQVIELYDSPEQPTQQEGEAVHAAWMAGYTEGEREAIEKQIAQQQEPVAIHQFRTPGCSDWYDGVPYQHEPGQHEVRTLYTFPPASKPWVGLTDEDVTWLCNTAKSHEQTWGMFVRAIESKLREKNA